MPIVKSVSRPTSPGRRTRRNRFRFQGVGVLFGVEPRATRVHPLPLSETAFHLLQPIHDNPLAFFRTAALEPRKIMDLGSLDTGHFAPIDTSLSTELSTELSTKKLAPLILTAPCAQEATHNGLFQADLKLVPSDAPVSFTTTLEALKTFGPRALDHPPVADLLAAVEVTPSAGPTASDMDDGFQPFAPMMEAPTFVGDTQPIPASTELGADPNAASAANLWPLIDADKQAVPRVEAGAEFGESAELEDDPFYEEPVSLRDYAASSSQSLMQAIRHFLLGRRFSQALALGLLVIFVGTLHDASRAWIGAGLEKARNAVEVAINTGTRPIRERAAFFIVDDFDATSADNWLSAGTMNFDAGGLGRVDGLALREDTLGLENYRYDFDAKVEKDAIGWVVRAPDLDNYYAFKLVETRRRASRSYNMLRYVVLNGERVADEADVEIPVPGHLTRPDDFNRISVRVRDNQITTLINGWGVDFWKDSRLERGGVGFFSDEGESALISHATVSGNDDTWGLILYGTIETIRSIRDTVSARVAMSLSRFLFT